MAARKVELELDISSNDDGLDTAHAARELKDLQDAADATKDAIGDISRADVEISVEDRALATLEQTIRDLRRQMSDDIEMGVDITDARKDLSRAEADYRTLKKSIERDRIEIDVVVDESAGSGLGAAGAATTEFKEEAISNFSEVTSSFDGSMASIGDLAQGTLGGLAAGFTQTLGGIKGLMAGLGVGVAAAGVGLAISALEKMEEQAQETRDAAADLATELLEAGISADDFAASGEATVAFIDELARAGAQSFHWFWEDARSGLDEFNDDINEAGISQSEFFRVLSGGSDDLDRYISQLEASKDALAEQMEARQINPGTYQREKAVLDRLIVVLEDEQDKRDAATTATEAYEAAQDSAANSVETLTGYVDEATEALDAVTESFKAWTDELGNSRADYDDVLDATDALSQAIKDNGTDFTSNAVEARANRDALADVTGAQVDLLEGMIDAGEGADSVRGQYAKMRGELVDQLTQMGLNKTEAGELADEYLGTTGDWEANLLAYDKGKETVEAAQDRVDGYAGDYYATLFAGLSQSTVDNLGLLDSYRSGGSNYVELGRSAPRAGVSPRLAPARDISQPINMVRVSIAGREVEAQVGSVLTTARESEHDARLLGAGMRA